MLNETAKKFLQSIHARLEVSECELRSIADHVTPDDDCFDYIIWALQDLSNAAGHLALVVQYYADNK